MIRRFHVVFEEEKQKFGTQGVVRTLEKEEKKKGRILSGSCKLDVGGWGGEKLESHWWTGTEKSSARGGVRLRNKGKPTSR